jgi:hypothetical protein
MSKAADQARRLAAGAAAASASREPVAEQVGDTGIEPVTPIGGGPVQGRPPRVRDVRRTVDLSPVEHRELAVWCAEAAAELGRARVTGQDVLRALVVELLSDDALARRIREVI